MQTILNTGSQANTSTTGSEVSAAGGGTPSELFTTLLVAQIRNQNPLEPTDPSEFVGQLTQLSQMEALQKLVTQTTASASMLESLQVMTLGAKVGSEVRVASSSVSLGGEPVRGSFSLADGRAATTLVLGVGSQRYRVELGSRPAGEVDFEIDPAKLGIPNGNYAMWVETDSDEQPVVNLFGTLRNVRLTASGDVALDVANVGDVAATSVTGFNSRND